MHSSSVTIKRQLKAFKLNYKEPYIENGWIIVKNAFPSNDLSKIEDFISTQYIKNFEKFFAYVDPGVYSSCRKSFRELFMLNDKYWGQFNYEFMKSLRTSHVLNKFQVSSLIPLLASVLDVNVDNLYYDGQDLFANCPSTDRLKYKPHREVSYYPLRKLFWNTWMPLYSDRGLLNSTLRVYNKSHLWPDEGYSGTVLTLILQLLIHSNNIMQS